MNHSIRKQACALVALALSMGSAGLASAQVCVDPAGGGCQTTIQGGVDVATAGQTITIAAAVYSETVVIPAGLDGLVLTGAGAVLDNPTTEDGIQILSNDVTVRSLAFRNGNNGIRVGDGFLFYPSGTVLTGLSFNAGAGNCIALEGADDTLITGSSFTSCEPFAISGSEGADVEGSDATVVTKNRFRICGDGCVDLTGDDAVVSGNRLAQSEDGFAIAIAGEDAVVEKNTIVASSGGIGVFGGHPTVVKNKVSFISDSSGIEVACTGACDGALVSTNKVSSSIDDTQNFQIFADAAGLVVSKNSSTNSSDNGFSIDGIGVIVTGNKSAGSGGDAYEAGFDISGSDHVLTGNTSSGSASDGFLVYGDGHELTGNVATGNGGDGFEISNDGSASVGVVVTGNTATANVGQGFAVENDSVDPIDVTFTGNTSTSNRTPFCVDVATGAPTDGGGNSFTVAGAPACEVDND